jgi:UDP-2,3-diacylglucosamine hydrolase
MRPTLFISDLHLAGERPEISALFFRFIDEIAFNAEALYILGDLFDYWVGDDQLDHDPFAHNVADVLSRLAKTSVKIFFMHGNRDFLISDRFAHEASLTILPEPTLIELSGERVLLMHGDTLCTDDVAYHQFRNLARSEKWQRDTLAKPYAERNALARAIRMQSDSAKAQKSDEIMDVTPATVESVFRANDFPKIIHGHTHRVAHHVVDIDGRKTDRWVLPDWDQCGGYFDFGTKNFQYLAI